MTGREIARLGHAIRDYFKEGVRIDAHTAQQIDSTLGPLPPEELRRRLADAADCDNSTLVHLVFSPDRRAQIRLEPALGSSAWSSNEIAALEHDLLARGLNTTIGFADGRDAVYVPVPPEGVGVFLEGLHLDRGLPEAVLHAVDRHLPEEARMATRVLLRNAGITGYPAAVKFLCRLLQHASMLQPDLQSCLALAAALAATADAHTDLFERLGMLKEAHARRLRQARDSENALQRGNAESVMMSGRNLFQIDPHEALQRMACIDAVALAAFGRLPIGIEHVQALEIGGRRDAGDILQRIGDLFR